MNLYLILGVREGAKEAEIKRAYRRLARRFHPDINPGDRESEARFRQILDAYETLIDPVRRSRYEAGQTVEPGGPPTSGFEGFDFSVRGSDHAVTFGDLFAEVLGERGTRQTARPAAQRGADLHQDVHLSFDEAFSGVTRAVAVTRREDCRTCAGSGLAQARPAACLVCDGTGHVRSARGHMVFSRSCGSCRGSGQQRPRACVACGGAGQEVRAETVTVRVPGGVAHGDRVRAEGQGNAGLHGGARGDLYLLVHVLPHPDYRRDGDDLHLTVPVAIHEAALGARIEVPAPDGPVRLRVPPGSQSGQRFRLRERGMPARDGTRGDLIVELQLRLPVLLDERSKELLREFGRIHGTQGEMRTAPGHESKVKDHGQAG